MPFMKSASAAGLWVSSTSASPVPPSAIAAPEPTNVAFIVYSGHAARNAGPSRSNRPESFVDVVDASRIWVLTPGPFFTVIVAVRDSVFFPRCSGP